MKKLISFVLIVSLILLLFPFSLADEYSSVPETTIPSDSSPDLPDEWLNVPVDEALETVNSLIEESKSWTSADDVPYTFQSFPIHPAIDLTQENAITGLGLPNPSQYDDTFKTWLYNTDTKKFDAAAYLDGLYECLGASSYDNSWSNEISIWRQGKIDLFRCSYSNYEGGSWTVSFSTGESYLVSENEDGSRNVSAVYEITIGFDAESGKCISMVREELKAADEWLDVPVNEALETVNSLIEESKSWISADDVPYTFQSFPIHPAIDLTQKDAITGLELPDPRQYDDTFKTWLFNTDTKKFDAWPFENGLYECLMSSSFDDSWSNEISIWRQGKNDLFRCSYSNYEGGSWTVSFSTGESYLVSENEDGSRNVSAVYEITIGFDAESGKCISMVREELKAADEWLDVPVNEALETVNSLIEESMNWISADDVPYTFQSFPIHPAIDLTQKDAITGLELPDPYQDDDNFKTWLYNTDTKKFDTAAYQDGLYECLEVLSFDNSWSNGICIWRQGKVHMFECKYSDDEGGLWTVSFSTGESYLVSKNEDGSTTISPVYKITLRFDAKSGKCVEFKRNT